MSALTQYYQAAEQFNAQGAAKGSLHGYAGGTNYAMGGWAMVGERGPELMRVPSGSQIVPNHLIGGYANGLNIPGGTTVNIINNAGASVSSEEGMDANGAKMIVVTIEKAVASAIAKGKMDGPMRSRYGARYVGRSTT